MTTAQNPAVFSQWRAVADSRLLSTFALAFTLLLQAMFTYVVLDPTVGFDDANITQVYARHLAEGHGYVYNIGGERVEGSTSLLWTLINAAMFWTPFPIAMITVLSFLLTGTTLFLSGRIVRELGGSDTAVALTILSFNLFPGFFAWSLWSLMDITLWVSCITFLVYGVLHIKYSDEPAAWVLPVFLVVCALMPLVRPEGIAVTLALAVFVVAHGIGTGERHGFGYWIALLSVLSLAAATYWRYAYFGYPVPNTFYAKTSPDLLSQSVQGARYVVSFFREPANAIFVAGLATCIAVMRISQDAVSRFASAVVLFLVAGGMAVYTVLGGDHFGSHRFLLYTLPIGLPLIFFSLTGLIERHRNWLGLGLMSGVFLLYFAVFSYLFYTGGGGVSHEFRIAENNREFGRTLSEIPQDLTLAAIPAGGIKMNYPGVVYDVLGLNWTKMAHAGDVNTGVVKNHGSFHADVFIEARPDLAFARQGDCGDGREGVLSGWTKAITADISDSAWFKETYEGVCGKGVVFYARRELLPLLRENGFEVYPGGETG